MALSWGEVWQWYMNWLETHPAQWFPSASYRLPAPNFICVVLNVWLMLALARFWWSESKLEKVLLGLYVLSSLALIYLTSSRGGWIGTLAGFGTLFLTAVYLAPEKWLDIWRRIRRIRGGVVGVALLVLAGISLFSWMMIRQDFQPSHSPLFQSRSYLWGPAWHAFLASPIVGNGTVYFHQPIFAGEFCSARLFFRLRAQYLPGYFEQQWYRGFAAAGWLGFTILKTLVKPLRGVEPHDKGCFGGFNRGFGGFCCAWIV